jgi:hypothetical protein
MLIKPVFFHRLNRPSVDADATAFLASAGIINESITTTINELVIDLKSVALWNKMVAIYPFVGGTAQTHKWNLKNPVDSNAAFRLSFLGTVTHDINGITPNGTNGYADTFYIPSSNIVVGDYASLSIYSRTNSITATIRSDMSLYQDSGGTGFFSIGCGYNNTNQVAYFYADLPNAHTYTHYGAQGANTNTTGFYSGYIGATKTALYKNGVEIISNTHTKVNTRVLPTAALVIGAERYNGVARRFSNKNIAFAHIGKGMTDADMVALNTVVQKFQTSLSRNV